MIIEDDKLIKLSKSTESKKKKIVVPKYVTEIGESAFEKSTIEYVVLPKDLNKIGDRAFRESSIRKIKMNKNLTRMGDRVFNRCEQLRSISLPKSLEFIPEYAFSGCSNLSKINFPEGIALIGANAFEGCKSLKTDIILPNSVQSIDDSAFSNCGLTSIVLPDEIKVIPNKCFTFSNDLKSAKLPSNLTLIKRDAFGYCTDLEEISLPETLKEIQNNAFQSSGLKEITIPENCTTLGQAIFKHCSNLKNVKLPSNLTEIPNGMFKFCISLSEIQIPNKVKRIGSGAFDSSNIKNIELPDSIEQIGFYAFAETPIVSINIPSKIKKIEEKTFYGCKNLEKVNLNENIEEIEENAFTSCLELRNIDLPKNLKILGDGAFSNSALEKIIIPDSVTNLGLHCFKNCKNLKEVQLPKNLETIENTLFYLCTKLEKISLPETLKSINSSAFSGCASLKNISIPKNVNYIGERTFSNCISLESIELSEITELEEETFKNCKNLKGIKIPNTVKSIRKNCFEDCVSLESIDIPNSVDIIHEDAFKNCTSLSSIFIPDSVMHNYALKSLNPNLRYFTKVEGGYKITSKPLENSYDFSSAINMSLLGTMWNRKEEIMKDSRNPAVRNFINTYLSDLNEYVIENFYESHNYTYLKKISNFDSQSLNYNTYKFLYNFGIFQTPKLEKDKKVDYGQITSNFIINKLSKNEITIPELNEIFDTMENQGFKKEFSLFFMNNFDALLSEERKNPGFISKSYNLFESVQETNTSNRGSQRQLKPTIQKFIEYFNKSKFENVTPNTKYIADAISPYFSSQDTFEYAVEIEDKFKKENIPTRLLKTRLVDKSSPFLKIDEYASQIQDMEKDTLSCLTDIATNEFTFDWLEKNDPTNLILGKLCSCCAHLEGAGRSIMISSILHPNVQNLVIRDKRNKIIAKSTLYINPKEGYGVFNNVEIKNSKEFDNPDAKQKIYEKYIEAVTKFAEQYNLEHPQNKLTQINVGDGNNDLHQTLSLYHNMSTKKFMADYSKITPIEKQFAYQGDSNYEQFVIWKLNDKHKKNSKEENYEKGTM